MGFRHDINGLRALAVLAVVLFHFQPTWLPGGFAGVDVFFVISGFLMTSIIFNGIEKNTFNLFSFYNARANRIIPVLSAMSLVLLIFGWFYLIPNDYEILAKEIEYSSFFLSNTLFARSDGYFVAAEKTKWLLHTWSLSVEWQFYIIFPLIILSLKKLFKRSLSKPVVLTLFIISFIYCVYLTNKNSDLAYLMLTSRAWEMLLGGLAFLYPLKITNKKLQISNQALGLVLIILSYFFISKETPWPGYLALIPTLGAYLVLVSNFQNNFLLKNIFTNHIGKWSYSIYVWHWPLVVFGFYFSIKDFWLIGIPLSILLGFVSYQIIESIKFEKYNHWKQIYKVKALYMTLSLLTLAVIIQKTEGMKFHYSNEINKILDEAVKDDTCTSPFSKDTINLCSIGNKNNIKAIVVGDSHAKEVTSSVRFNLKNNGILSITKPGCPFLLPKSLDKNNCYNANLKRISILDSNPYLPVIISNRFTPHFEEENNIESQKRSKLFTHSEKQNRYFQFENFFKSKVCHLTKTHQVYIVLQVPEISFDVPKTLARKILLNRPLGDFSLPYSDYVARSEKLNRILMNTAKSCNAKIIDPTQVLCKSGKCITLHNNLPIYRDGNHLNESGNRLLAPLFKEIVNH